MEQQEIISHIYTAFNNRDIAGVLKFFSADVKWPNGWEGGYLHGHEQVHNYWTRQWAGIDPIVTPTGLQQPENGQLLVKVRQLVKDLNGTVIADSMVNHSYLFEDGLVKQMVIG
jgi:nuclear transport factor 2 (NTF2) superfamily protein